jgi:hypothetical protein
MYFLFVSWYILTVRAIRAVPILTRERANAWQHRLTGLHSDYGAQHRARRRYCRCQVTTMTRFLHARL